MTRRLFAAAILLLAIWIASVPDDARGCAPAMHAGEIVDVADETAFIIWDDAADTEHFIRQATFVGSAYDFGFLVPTPNRPRVEAASADVFAELARITEPKTEQRRENSYSFGCAASPAGKNEAGVEPAPTGAVVVLEQKRIGNLDAAVLAFRADKTRKFDDTADELLVWLNRNGYAARPELKDWLKDYIENNWIITAFKIAGQPAPETPPPASGKTISVKAAAVRMSFKTDRPFFPYREPIDQRDAQSRSVPRLLRVFIAAKERMAGKIGETINWPGQTVWANAISDSERGELLGKVHLPPETFLDKWWITEFEDRSTPRPGTDEVYFDRSLDRGAVARPPIIVTTYKNPWWVGPLAVLLVLVIGGAALTLIRRYLIGGDDEIDPAVLPQALDDHEQKSDDPGHTSGPRRWS
jgi:Uncharacterized protein conserved in bacteria (DUF2330)